MLDNKWTIEANKNKSLKRHRNNKLLLCIASLVGLTSFLAIKYAFSKFDDNIYKDIIYFNGIKKKPEAANCDQFTGDYITRNLKNAPSNIPFNQAKQYPLIDGLFCEQTISMGKSYFSYRGSSKIHFRIYGKFVPSRVTLLHATGISGNVLHGARYIRMAERLNVNFVVMEYTNHGLSSNDGRGVSYGCQEGLDISSVVRHLAGPKFEAEKIVIFASSLGNISTLRSLRDLRSTPKIRNKVKGFIFESPIPNLRLLADSVVKGKNENAYIAAKAGGVPEFVIGPFKLISRAGFGETEESLIGNRVSHRRGFDILSGCQAIKGAKLIKEPTLFLHAEPDLAVSKQLAEQFVALVTNLSNVEFLKFSNGAHSVTWNYNKDEVERGIADLLNKI